MKKYMEKVLFVLLMLSASGINAAYNVGPVDITYLRTYDDYAVFSISQVGQNLDNCTRSSAAHFVYLDMKESKGKAMYAAALSAFLAGRKVRFAVSGCGAWGSTTLPKAYRVDIYKQ